MSIASIAKRISYFYDAARFVAHKHIHGYEVNPEPTFEDAGLAFFEYVIRDTSTYLEYGSGGSTILASRFVKTLVSVESDRVFRDAVERALPPSTAEIHLLSPNIGITHEWGTPVFGRPTPSRMRRWRKYPEAPWPALKGRMPETILVDGRLRVACALEGLLNVGRDTRVLVDDYVGRNYSVIENHADLIALHGIMAEFRKKTDFDANRCRKALDDAYADLR